ncbi:MAG: hypothetical protein AAFZ15_17340 [Bacteroidota bacterium]
MRLTLAILLFSICSLKGQVLPAGNVFSSISSFQGKLFNEGDVIFLKNTGTVTTYDVVSSTDLTVDSLSVIPLHTGFAVINAYSNVNARDFGITGKLSDSTGIRKLIFYCARLGYCAYFPAGTYQIDTAQTIRLDTLPACILGDGDKTIFTTSEKINFRFTERVSLASRIPRKLDGTVRDGFYIADIVPAQDYNFSSEWSSLFGTVSLDDYLKVENGVPSVSSRVEALDSGYIAEVEMVNSEPSNNGLYVVTRPDFSWGGGQIYSALSWEPGTTVQMGTVVKNSGGIWARYPLNVWLDARGDITVKSVTIDNFGMIPIGNLTSGGTSVDGFHQKKMLVEDCQFSHVPRVFAMETNGTVNSATGPVYSVRNNDPNVNPSSSDRLVYHVFDKVIIRNNVFDNYFHSVGHGWPVTKDMKWEYNTFQNAPNCLAGFNYQPTVLIEGTSCSVRNNTFLNINHWNPEGRNRRAGFNVEGNGEITDNLFIGCSGTHIRTSYKSDIRGNNLTPVTYWIKDTTTAVVQSFILTKQDGRDLVGNKITGGIGIGCSMQSSRASKILNNEISLGYGFRRVYEGVDYVDTRYCYTVSDSATFASITQKDLRDTTIADGDLVFYNPRTFLWSRVSDFNSNPTAYDHGLAVNYDYSNNEYTQPVYFEKNHVNANVVLKTRSSSKLIDLKVLNNTITCSELLQEFTFKIEDITISGNDIECNLLNDMPAPSRSLIVNNNTWRLGRNQTLLEADTGALISFTNNQVYGLRNVDESLDPSGVAFARLYFHAPRGVVKIKDNDVSSNNARNRAIIIRDCDTVVIINNEFYAELNSPTFGASGNFSAVQIDSSIKFLELSHNIVDYDDIVTGTKYLITVSSSATVDEINIFSNASTEDLTNLVNNNGSVTNLIHGYNNTEKFGVTGTLPTNSNNLDQDFQFIKLTPIDRTTALSTGELDGDIFIVPWELDGWEVDSVSWAITGTAGATSGNMTVRVKRFNSSNIFVGAIGTDTFNTGETRRSKVGSVPMVAGDMYLVEVTAESFATDAEGISATLRCILR